MKPKCQSQGVTATPHCTATREKVLGESIISVLVKLHDKMASPPTLYRPQAAHAASSSAAGNHSTRKHSEVQVDPSVLVTGHRLYPPLLQVITVPEST